MTSSQKPEQQKSLPGEQPSSPSAPQTQKHGFRRLSLAEAEKLGIPIDPVLVLSPTPSRGSKPSPKG